ncbi:MAG: cupin domain-containing protein [Actinomycetota bacterium]|nr:cupin domain-containing protein [Actinomycetota bacterium]
MADYTVLNLRDDVADSAEGFGLAPDLEAHFASGNLGLTRSGISFQRLAPGFRLPFGHRHDQQEELYVVLSGALRAKVEEDVVELGRLDALRVAPEVTRQFEAGPEGAELLAFGAPHTGPPSEDVEMQPGWWSE